MEGEFHAVPKTFTIDIGADGGKITVDQTQPVTKYVINGVESTEEEAWYWVHAWHLKRDMALGDPPCPCTPCCWVRAELERKSAQ